MSKKILLVEDDKALSSSLTKRFEQTDYALILIEDGAEAVASIRSEKPDLILLDIILPHKNGYEILTELHNDPTLKTIPVVVISNSGQPVEISKILELGARDYMVKAQFEPDDVIDKVRQVLQDQAGSSREGHPALKGRKILWVEDDKFLGDIIEKKFSTQGTTLTHVTNGEDALKALDQQLPDVIALDLLLPGMDGFEVLKRIKAIDKAKNIPVVILSNLGQASDMNKAKELGAALFLVKAEHTLDEVTASIVDVLNKK